MKQSLAVWVVALLLPLTITACQRVADAVAIAESNADAAAYVSQFSAMHSAIPGAAGKDTEEYQ
jgi:hypothetical protein